MIIYQKNCLMSCSNFAAIQCQDKCPTDKVGVLKHKSCAYQGVKNVRFFEKFGILCFFETPVLRFALLSYYRQNIRQ